MTVHIIIIVVIGRPPQYPPATLPKYGNHIQGGTNMTRTNSCVNKPHCAAAVRPWESEATTSTLPPARVRTCSVLSAVNGTNKSLTLCRSALINEILSSQDAVLSNLHCHWFPRQGNKPLCDATQEPSSMASMETPKHCKWLWFSQSRTWKCQVCGYYIHT
jgi:hypothetical protein